METFKEVFLKTPTGPRRIRTHEVVAGASELIDYSLSPERTSMRASATLTYMAGAACIFKFEHRPQRIQFTGDRAIVPSLWRKA